MGTAKAPGLKRVKREGGKVDLYWACSAKAREAGFPIRSVPLDAYAHDPDLLVIECRRLQGEMMLWLAKEQAPADPYDGTIGGLIKLYQSDPESRYRNLKPASLIPYAHYCSRIVGHVGERVIAGLVGKDVKRWFAVWSSDGEHPAAGQFALNVLKAALAWGAICGHPECGRLREAIVLLRLAGTRPRQGVFSVAQVNATREQAHAARRPSVALTTALQFEGTLRLWDVIGQWAPLDAPGLSAITREGKKWLGLVWSDIDAANVLRLMPAKTDDTTQARVAIDLSLCPMVLEELERIPAEFRSGPVIVNEKTGLPYRAQQWRDAWRRIATKAGIPKAMWSRDIRASAVTEARQHGASTDDAAKVAGHAKPKTTAEVYDRDRLEAARRVSKARVAGRNRPET